MNIDIEWVDGLPPVGVECRMTLGFGEYDRVKITYMGDGVFCYLNMRTELEYTGALYDATFRPLKTPEQRLREELESLLSEHRMSTVRDCARDIISNYTLTEKE